MRLLSTILAVFALTTFAGAQQPATASTTTHSYAGFDSNLYPGDAALPVLRKSFAFAGYWLTNPPGAHQNTWVGKRAVLVRNGFGFLVLADGRLAAEIGRAKKRGVTPAA